MKTLFKTVLILYLVMLLWLVLFKFSMDLTGVFAQPTRTINLIPFVDISTSLAGMIENGFIFIPFGLLLSANFKEITFRRKLATITLFSVGIEVTQLIFGIGVTDITDVIMNTLGGLIGLLLYDFGRSRMRMKKLDTYISLGWMAVCVLIICVIFSHRVIIKMGPTADVELQRRPEVAKNVQLSWPATGQSAIGSVEDGVLAHSSNSETLQPTASMAKVITALAILQKQPLQSGQVGPTYTVTAEDVATYHSYVAKGGSAMPVYEGMRLTQYQALEAMLLPSANNIADMLAEKTFGSIDAYKLYAQKMLRDMGCDKTELADASGFSSATVSTPTELVQIGIAALKNPILADIVSQRQAFLPGVGIVTNTNQLLGADGVVGIKTGTTDEAGNCLLFAAHYLTKEGKNMTIVGVVMGDTNEEAVFNDSKLLLASARQGYGLTDPQATGSTPPPRSGAL